MYRHMIVLRDLGIYSFVFGYNFSDPPRLFLQEIIFKNFLQKIMVTCLSITVSKSTDESLSYSHSVILWHKVVAACS